MEVKAFIDTLRWATDRNPNAIKTIVHPEFLKRHGWAYACELSYEEAKHFVLEHDPTDRHIIEKFMFDNRTSLLADEPFLKKLIEIIPIDQIGTVYLVLPRKTFTSRIFELDRYGFPIWLALERRYFAPRVCLVHMIHGGLMVDVVRLVAKFLITD